VTVEMLLQKSGIEVNARDSYRRTPMMLAAALGNEALVITLMNAGGCVCVCVCGVCVTWFLGTGFRCMCFFQGIFFGDHTEARG